MAKTTIADRLRYFLGFGAPSAPINAISLSLNQPTNLTPQQKAIALQTAAVSTQNKNKSIPFESVIQCFTPINQKIAADRKAAEQIQMLAPEVSQAAAIMIPTILSPNDLQDSGIGYELETFSELDENSRKQLIDYVETKFNNELKFHKLLPEWMKSALYGVGSQPIIIIPESELDHLFNHDSSFMPGQSKVGIESIREHLTPLTPMGSLDNKLITEMLNPKTKQSSTTVVDAIASEAAVIVNSYSSKPENQKRSKNDLFTTAVESVVKNIVAVNEGKIVDDNPNVLKQATFTKENAQKLSSTIIAKLTSNRKYKKRDFVDISDHSDYEMKKDGVGPLFMEVPAESIIPIYIPGTPSKHVGYFMMIDNTGNPVTTPYETTSDATDHEISFKNKNLYDSLFSTMGLNELTNSSGNLHSEATNKIYNMVIDSHIHRVLSGVGLDNIEIGNINAIYKCMFTRYLKNAGTRLLYIPKDLCIYFTYDYHSDGTGRSKLENVKFPLSMRITLFVCAMMAAIRDAADKKTISFDATDLNTDPLAFMKELQRIYVSKTGLSFNIQNPEMIRDALNDNSLTFKPTGLPGLNGFSVDRETTPSQTVQPDLTILNEFGEMSVHGLGVPPATLNRTGEDEYSRSVATTNLFFHNTILHFQAETCEMGSDVIQTYLTYDSTFHELIKSLLTDSTTFKQLVGETDISDEIYDTFINKIIGMIHMTLPTPNVAPNRAQHEELSEMIDLIERLSEVLFSDQWGEQSENNEFVLAGLAKAREEIRRTLITEYIKNSGSGFLNSVCTIAEKYTDITALINAGKSTKDTISGLTTDQNSTDEDSGNNGFVG